MLKYIVAAFAFTAMCATPADAQTDPTALPPVETLTCEQMQAELMVAGQQMNAQLDPEFAAEAQRMHAENQAASRGVGPPSIAAGVGTSFACSIPGVGYACMAAQQAQAANAQAQQAEHMSRMNAQNERLQASMAGIDQQRMMAVSDRFEQQRCETPQ